MKNYEIHAFVSYTTEGGTRCHDCYLDYVTAKNETEARKIYREELKADGIRLVRAEILEA